MWIFHKAASAHGSTLRGTSLDPSGTEKLVFMILVIALPLASLFLVANQGVGHRIHTERTQGFLWLRLVVVWIRNFRYPQNGPIARAPAKASTYRVQGLVIHPSLMFISCLTLLLLRALKGNGGLLLGFAETLGSLISPLMVIVD